MELPGMPLRFNRNTMHMSRCRLQHSVWFLSLWLRKPHPNRNRKQYGQRFQVRGVPVKFIHGHNGARSGPLYLKEDRGYKTLCWIWQRTKNRDGYGMIHRIGISCQAHVAFYEERYGPVPEGMQLDHLCRQRPCINPEHLEAVTFAVNIARGASCWITREMIEMTRALLAEGKRQVDIASIVGISQAAVSDIKLGKKNWRLKCPQLQK